MSVLYALPDKHFLGDLAVLVPVQNSKNFDGSKFGLFPVETLGPLETAEDTDELAKADTAQVLLVKHLEEPGQFLLQFILKIPPLPALPGHLEWMAVLHLLPLSSTPLSLRPQVNRALV